MKKEIAYYEPINIRKETYRFSTEDIYRMVCDKHGINHGKGTSSIDFFFDEDNYGFTIIVNYSKPKDTT